MTRFVLTTEARNDLDQIWQFIADGSEARADTVSNQVNHLFLQDYQPRFC